MNYKLPTTSYPNRLNDPKSTLCLSAFVAMPSFLYICRGFFTNHPFLCKTNPILSAVGGLQMNVSSILTTDYENKSNWTLGKNKPNSNPIKPNFQKAQMNVNSLITKDYRKKDDFAVRKNKPNSNPISVKPKMSASVFVTKDYDNVTAFRPQKNKPNQSQSLVKDLIALVSAWMFISKTAKKFLWLLPSAITIFPGKFNKPGERKAECSARPKLRTDPMNLLGIMPAKEGKIDLKHSFLSAVADCRSAFCFFTVNRICVIRVIRS